MTIDEAIKHAKEIAKDQRERAEDLYEPFPHFCRDCAEEHEQFTEWLEQLRTIQNIVIDWETNEHNFMYMDMISKVLRGE